MARPRRGEAKPGASPAGTGRGSGRAERRRGGRGWKAASLPPPAAPRAPRGPAPGPQRPAGPPLPGAVRTSKPPARPRALGASDGAGGGLQASGPHPSRPGSPRPLGGRSPAQASRRGGETRLHVSRSCGNTALSPSFAARRVTLHPGARKRRRLSAVGVETEIPTVWTTFPEEAPFPRAVSL